MQVINKSTMIISNYSQAYIINYSNLPGKETGILKSGISCIAKRTNKNKVICGTYDGKILYSSTKDLNFFEYNQHIKKNSTITSIIVKDKQLVYSYEEGSIIINTL